MAPLMCSLQQNHTAEANTVLKRLFQHGEDADATTQPRKVQLSLKVRGYT